MKVYMTWTYKHAKKQSCTFQSDFINGRDALVICEDLEKTGRAHQIEFYDERDTVWNKKELTKLLTEIKEEPQDAVVYFDGGYLKEDRLAGLGMIVYYTQNEVSYRKRQNKRMEQLTSSNEAEYAAFYESLCILEDLGVHHQTCTFKGDSHVVLQQLSGEWPCFDDLFNTWLDRIEEKMKKLGIHPIYEPISRKENKEADALASQALEGTHIDSVMKLTSKGDI
ncbi:ribonuclease H family protein [Bacillus sp. JJ722]|uniref:ribonuclease H family protein n=1 Tax=Bacillus sp. JJ722 TaxID=3122973 RepID=UPI002FFFE0DE